jgi:hypothetical protein
MDRQNILIPLRVEDVDLVCSTQQCLPQMLSHLIDSGKSSDGGHVFWAYPKGDR